MLTFHSQGVYLLLSAPPPLPQMIATQHSSQTQICSNFKIFRKFPPRWTVALASLWGQVYLMLFPFSCCSVAEWTGLKLNNHCPCSQVFLQNDSAIIETLVWKSSLHIQVLSAKIMRAECVLGTFSVNWVIRDWGVPIGRTLGQYLPPQPISWGRTRRRIYWRHQGDAATQGEDADCTHQFSSLPLLPGFSIYLAK